ncbi:MAG TPA: PilZ domain-containing protein [Nitrospirae bacterium]|nr:PilZ domain-containing protein [Nitrospirota bacterium]
MLGQRHGGAGVETRDTERCSEEMTDGATERRKNKRYDVEGIEGCLTFVLNVRILNMSLDGMAVESNHMISVNKEYTIKVNHKDELLDLRGRVIWSKLYRTVVSDEGDVVPIYRAGIRFEGVLSEKTLSLLEFIEKSRILTLEKRILGRFNLKSGDAHMQCPHNFTVKKISLSGMLIESDAPLAADSEFVMTLTRSDDGKELSIRGRVASLLEPELADEPYRIGIEFVSPTDDDRKVLKAYIDSLL